jgi:hypothetical protein
MQKKDFFHCCFKINYLFASLTKNFNKKNTLKFNFMIKNFKFGNQD